MQSPEAAGPKCIFANFIYRPFELARGLLTVNSTFKIFGIPCEAFTSPRNNLNLGPWLIRSG